MPEEDREEEGDKSIVDALSTLGWVEEKEEDEETTTMDENLQEQLNFFIEENKRLLGEINEKNEKLQVLEEKIQNLSQKVDEKTVQSEDIEKLYETIENKDREIKNLDSTLNEQSTKLNKIINDQIEKIKELTTQIEQSQSDQTETQALENKLNEKQIIIKELKEQLEFLENDSIQKSKFEKLEVLLEKKDEIITEKEKEIFTLENEQNTAKQKIHDLQQQIETFNLVKKELEMKIERNKSLAVEIEEIKQRNITNQQIIDRLEEKLEEAHKKSGILTGKFELELANLRNILDEKENVIKNLRIEATTTQESSQEIEQLKEKNLDDFKKIKDEKMVLESEIEQKNDEIIELKKKIKLMRRDLQRNYGF